MYIIYVYNTLPLALVVHEISRHFWAAYDFLREKWLSLLHHITDKHCWRASKEFKLIKKCGHPRISAKDQKEIIWIENGSPAHVALEEVVTNKKFMKDVAKLTEFHHTGE